MNIEELAVEIAALLNSVEDSDAMLLLAEELATILERKELYAFSERLDYASWSASSQECFPPYWHPYNEYKRKYENDRH